MSIYRTIGFISIWLWLVASQIAVADDVRDLFVNDPPSLEEIDRQINQLSGNLETIINDKIPANLLKQAQALIVADMKKGGFLIALQAGKGLMVVRNSDGWSNPAMITLSSASFGFQVGVESKKVVLIFTKPGIAEMTLDGNLKLGAGLNLSVGPLATDVGTKTVFDREIYSYADGSGLFAGLSLEGSSIAFEPLVNEGLYGRKITAREIFTSNVNTEATSVAKLKTLLNNKVSL
jgi:lipid-binding SYLF domain-containing protein